MRSTAVALLAMSFLVSPAAWAQDFDAVEIRTVQVSDSIYMLMGEGGIRFHCHCRAALIAEGRTLEEIVAADPIGNGESAAVWVEHVYEELSSR